MLLPIVFSNHCNLDCAYCCITNKNTSPVLSLEKAIDHIEKNKSLYGEENLEIEFFGGEPTLHWNEIKAIIDKYPNACYKIITNGLMPILFEDYKYWEKIEDIIVSIDGFSLLYNTGRRLTSSQLNDILANTKNLLQINPNVGIGIVIGNQKQLNGLRQNLADFIDIGINYFALELVTVWEDDKPKYLEKEELLIFVDAVVSLIKDTTIGYLRVVHIPRELISGSFYFNKLKGKSCGEGVRALSPRGKVYLCRDHAADEEGLLKKIEESEYRPVRFIGEAKLDPLVGFQDDGNNFSQLDHYNVLTSCPVKSIQYETYGNPDKLWWLIDGFDTFQESILQPLWFLTEMNNKFVKDFYINGYVDDKKYIDFRNQLSLGIQLIEKQIDVHKLKTCK